jgi:hypothetical protein
MGSWKVEEGVGIESMNIDEAPWVFAVPTAVDAIR